MSSPHSRQPRDRNSRLPAGARLVNGRVWLWDVHGERSLFVEQKLLYRYPLGDVQQQRFCAAQLVEQGLATFGEVCRALEINARTFCRVRAKLRRGGWAALVRRKTGPKSRREKTESLTPAMVQMYRLGRSTYAIGHKLGVSPSTVARVLKAAGVCLRGATG